MTDDFKETLIDYITGNVVPTEEGNQQIIESKELISRDGFDDYLPDTFYSFDISGIIQSKTNGYFILYGGYRLSNTTTLSDQKGIILILDENLNPIKTLYEFSSGTTLRPIQKMVQLEDETFVAVDSTIFAYPYNRENIQSNEKRFIMLNNLSVENQEGEYEAKLRTSYLIPSSYRNFYCLDIVKNPNSAHYLLAGATYVPTSNDHYDGVRILDFKINVGSQNTWVNKTSTTSSYWIYGGFYAEFDENDVASYKMILTYNQTNNVSCVWWDGTSVTTILQENNDVIPYVDSLAMRNQAVFTNYDTAYFVINNQRWGSVVKPRYVGLYSYKFSTGTLKEIYLKNTGNYDWNGSKEGIFLNSLNGDLYVNYCDNYNQANSTANYNYQRLENDEWNPILIYENKKYFMELTLNYTFNIYNLVKNICMYAGMSETRWTMQLIKEIYNNSNYNYTPYIDYNSLIGKSGTIYNEDGLLFARNLYNITTNGNTTVSTLEIPNTMLNNTNLINKNLIGTTNMKLAENNDTTTKNIYETLFLNFINTINVIDQDTDIKYINSASNINEHINDASNTDDTLMNNKKVAKLKITYQDATETITPVELTQNSTYDYTLSLTFYIPKYIDTIDIISNDETETYISIDGSYLEKENIYTFSQNLKIE